MNTLVLNASPRKDGNSACIVEIIKRHIENVIVFNAYYNKFAPCQDCRKCFTQAGCVIRDDMKHLTDNWADNIIIVSPIYDGNLPAPMIAIHNRLQFLYANKTALGIAGQEKKHGAIILVRGGEHNPNVPCVAKLTATDILRRLGCDVKSIKSLAYAHTDKRAVSGDITFLKKVAHMVAGMCAGDGAKKPIARGAKA